MFFVVVFLLFAFFFFFFFSFFLGGNRGQVVEVKREERVQGVCTQGRMIHQSSAKACRPKPVDREREKKETTINHIVFCLFLYIIFTCVSI